MAEKKAPKKPGIFVPGEPVLAQDIKPGVQLEADKENFIVLEKKGNKVTWKRGEVKKETTRGELIKTWKKAQPVKPADINAVEAPGYNLAVKPGASDEDVIMVNQEKLNKELAKKGNFHIPPGGGDNEIGDRLPNARKAIKEWQKKGGRKLGQAFEAPSIDFTEGSFSVIDGRHRNAALSEYAKRKGLKDIPISVKKSQSKEILKKLGGKSNLRRMPTASKKPLRKLSPPIVTKKIKRLTKLDPIGKAYIEILNDNPPDLDPLANKVSILALEEDVRGRVKVTTSLRGGNTNTTPIRWSFGRVDFKEAVDVLKRKYPQHTKDVDRMAGVYRAKGRYVSKVVAAKLTGQIGQSLKNAAKKGLPMDKFYSFMKSQGLPEKYAEVVYRTNMNTAMNHGRYSQAVEMADLVGGFQYRAQGDSRTRPNHEAADGLMDTMDSKYWDYLYAPLGYNCRCVVLVVPPSRFKRNIPSGVKNGKARPDDPSFGKRPTIVK